MRDKKLRRVNTGVIALLLIMAVLNSGVFIYGAVFRNEVSVKNLLKTGSVDIDLTTWEVTEDGEVPAKPGENIAANQSISYLPRITVKRADCYVRLTVDIKMDKDIDNPITTENIINLKDGWEQRNNVFYYKGVLSAGDSADVFDGIYIPEAWTNDNSSSFQINLTADAIQAENFEPDFARDYPWGSVEIEEAKPEDGITYGSVKQVKQTHKLVYKGNCTFEVSSEDFFANFDYMMPGDTFSDKITLTNNGSKDIKLYFRSAASGKSQPDLLGNIGLSIKVGGRAYYSGNLKADKLKEYGVLTTLKAGESKTMSYELVIPEKLQNEFSVENDSVLWKFKAYEIGENGEIIKTGDDTNLLIYAVTGLASLALAICLMAMRRREGDDDVF